MASFQDIAAGLQIFDRLKPGKHLGGAEHDIIYGLGAEEVLDPKDRATLENAGWHIDEEAGCWARFV